MLLLADQILIFPIAKMLLHGESCNEVELQGGVALYGIFFSFHLTILSFRSKLFTVF